MATDLDLDVAEAYVDEHMSTTGEQWANGVSALYRMLRAAITELRSSRKRIDSLTKALDARTCKLCRGTGTVWCGEDEDRPARCHHCNGTGVPR
jgi:hypothetical protein